MNLNRDLINIVRLYLLPNKQHNTNVLKQLIHTTRCLKTRMDNNTYISNKCLIIPYKNIDNIKIVNLGTGIWTISEKY